MFKEAFRTWRAHAFRPAGTEADVRRLRSEWQAMLRHDCLACNDGGGDYNCSELEARNEAVNAAAWQVSARQERRVFRRLEVPRRGRTGARRWA